MPKIANEAEDDIEAVAKLASTVTDPESASGGQKSAGDSGPISNPSGENRNTNDTGSATEESKSLEEGK